MRQKSKEFDRLQVGDRIKVKVCEKVSSAIYLVSYDGEMIRVSNHSQLQFNIGDYIPCQVLGTHPIRLKLFMDLDLSKEWRA